MIGSGNREKTELLPVVGDVKMSLHEDMIPSWCLRLTKKRDTLSNYCDGAERSLPGTCELAELISGNKFLQKASIRKVQFVKPQ